MERGLRYFAYISLVLLVLIMGIMGGVVLDRSVISKYVPQQNIPADAQNEFKLMGEAWNTIHKVYVDRSALDSTQMTYGAISGMVDSLGDTGHSRFLSPDIIQAENRQLQGEFEGIGATVGTRNGNTVIIAPIDGSPAQKAGLKPGDIIAAVNGEPMAGVPLNTVVSKILGPAGTKVTLTIQDPDTGEKRDVTITRAKIILNNVTWYQIPGTTLAHVRIASFSKGISDDLKKALTEIQDKKLTGVVLDLRNNPGGLLDEGVGTASQFLASGDVLETRDANGNIKKTPVIPGGVATRIPLVLLVNQGSASASEIVSGAIQDAERGTLVGETTFGTGTVLSQYPLSDGSALLLANQEWLTPKGRVIWHKGIEPDVQVQMSAEITPLTPDAEKAMTAEQFKASQDSQILKAVDLLNQQANH
ncbi:MAG TPA: S41 family peptidase [Anaerolineaceae bacterium]|nr:S41 family peptidase [Anaerolineaceae bacterium]